MALTISLVTQLSFLAARPARTTHRRGGAPRCCATAAEELPGTFAPFIDSMMAIFEEAGVPLEAYPLADEHRQRETETGSSARQQRVQLSMLAYSSTKLRHIRVAHIQGGDSLQVLNLCLFPRLDFTLPTFSADLVTLPGGHLIAIDCQPNDAKAESDSWLRDAYELHRPKLPDGGPVAPETARFFSNSFLWSRLPLSCTPDEVRALVLPAFEDYLRCYLQAVADAEPAADAETLARVREGQLAYCDYRISKDPARGMLTRLFGTEYAEELIAGALFDLPRVLHLEADAGGE